MKNPKKIIILLLTGTLALAFNVQSVAAVDDWPMFRHDLKHTGRSTVVGPQAPNVKWTFPIGQGIRSSPAVGTDGTIYVGANDGKVHAINPNCTLKWSCTIGGNVYSSPAIGSDGTVYVGSSRETGSGSCKGRVYAINPDGSIKWPYPSSVYTIDIDSSPAIDPSSGVIYVGAACQYSWAGKMYALYPDGTLKWEFSPPDSSGWITASPAIREDGTILFGDYSNPGGILWALNPDSSVLWQRQISNPGGEIDIFSSAAIDTNGMIYFGGSVGDDNNRLWARNPDGTYAWDFPTGGYVPGSPAIGSDGTIYVGSYDNKLYAINNDGSEKWSYPTGGDIYSSPAVGGDDTIYVGSLDNNIYAINPNGSLKWSCPTGGAVYSSPAIGPDGTVYVGSYDGKLYAFAVGPTQTSMLTITTSDGGTTGPAPGTYIYPASLLVEVNAVPEACYLFDHWELDGNDVGSANPYSVLMDDDHTLHAVFTQITYDLTITATPGGTTDPTPGTYTNIACGSSVEVTAIPEADCAFSHWELDGDDIGSANPCSVLMDDDHTLYAVFGYDLTITATSGGTTDPTPGTHTYACGDSVEVTAIPEACYEFDHWELDGDDVGSANPYSVLMDDDHTLHAVFTQITYDLTITTTGGGTTDPAPGTHTYPCGDSVEVTAIPEACYLFDHWELDGDDIGRANPYSVLMDDDHTLHAVFTQITYDLTITAGCGGTTDPAPGTQTYVCGSSVEVTALPELCYLFDHWELDGDDVGPGDPYSVLMDTDHTMHGVFHWNPALAIMVDSNDLPVHEPYDVGGPPEAGPTEGKLFVSLAWQPGEDLGYPAFTVTVVIDPNLYNNGPHDDFIFPAGDTNGNVTLRFTDANWSNPQSVFVQAVKDLDREGNETYPIELTVTIDIADPNFQDKTVTTVVCVIDNDIPYISAVPDPCAPLEGTLSEDDPCAPVCFEVTLSHLPTDDVYVLVEAEGWAAEEEMFIIDPPLGDADDPNRLTFTVSGNPTWNSTTMTSNWDVEQTICLEARDDDELAEPWLEWVPGVIVLTPSSEDVRYLVPWLNADGSEAPTITDPCDPCDPGELDSGGEAEETTVGFNVQDNECGAWGYDETDVNEDCLVNLGDFTEFYAEWLICTDPYEDGCIKAWEFDGADGGSAKAYSPLDGTNHILQVDPNVMLVYETGETQGDFTVALTSQPGSGTTVNVAIDPNAKGPGLNDDFVLIGAGPGDPNIYLTFDSTNWDVPQVVRFRAIDDDEPEPSSQDPETRYFESHEILVSSTCAEDPNFNDIAMSVTVQVRDNDQADILFRVTPSRGGARVPVTGPVQLWEQGTASDLLKWRKIGFQLQVPPTNSEDPCLPPVATSVKLQLEVQGGSDNLPLTDPCLPLQEADDPNGFTFTSETSTNGLGSGCADHDPANKTTCWNVDQHIKIWGTDDEVLQVEAFAEGDQNYQAVLVVTVIDDGGDTRYTDMERSVQLDVEDNECGAYGILAMDVSNPYYVTDPNYAEDDPDCHVDIHDVIEMARRWLNCSDPKEDCESYL